MIWWARLILFHQIILELFHQLEDFQVLLFEEIDMGKFGMDMERVRCRLNSRYTNVYRKEEY